MRRPSSLVPSALAAVVVACLAVPAPGAAAVDRPVTGHWEARADNGAHVSFIVRRRGDSWRVEHMVVYRRCGLHLGSAPARPMEIRGGRFSLPAQVQPLLNVQGTFTGPRVATVRLGPSFGCNSRVNFRAVRVAPPRVAPGPWTGRDADGGAFSFRVDRYGRAVDDIRVTTTVACGRQETSLRNARLFPVPVPVPARRFFSLREVNIAGDAVRAIGGRFTGADTAQGQIRVVTQDAQGRTCDSGLIDWSAAPAPAGASPARVAGPLRPAL